LVEGGAIASRRLTANHLDLFEVHGQRLLDSAQCPTPR
jgi:hypothetical protein